MIKIKILVNEFVLVIFFLALLYSNGAADKKMYISFWLPTLKQDFHPYHLEIGKKTSITRKLSYIKQIMYFALNFSQFMAEFQQLKFANAVPNQMVQCTEIVNFAKISCKS